MKPRSLLLIGIIFFLNNNLFAQNKSDSSRIDILLIRGDYEKVIDTCQQILGYDSLNPEIQYKMGVAYQNLLSDDKSLACFLRAASLSPENRRYNFMLAKGYYNKGKFKLAKPLLFNLCTIDTMNWSYAYYLTGIYMAESKYDESLNIYKRFYEHDSSNYVYLDKIAYASLKKGDFKLATDLYNRSLTLNTKNVIAIKNLAYLYTVSDSVSKAIQLLTNGIKIDPDDIDLYVRRAQIYYTIHYNKKALDDYLVILSSGDSSVTYLKRAGIGYSNNLQPKEAVRYLQEAYNRDSSDYEICNYLGQEFSKQKDFISSIRYYNRAIKILNPVISQMSLTYVLLAEVMKSRGMYNEAISNYLIAKEYKSDPNIYMIIANIYDNNLNDKTQAIYYYQMFLDNLKNSRMIFPLEYVSSVKKRVEYLKKEAEK